MGISYFLRSQSIFRSHTEMEIAFGAWSLAGLVTALIESCVLWDGEERCEKTIWQNSQNILASLFLFPNIQLKHPSSLGNVKKRSWVSSVSIFFLSSVSPGLSVRKESKPTFLRGVVWGDKVLKMSLFSKSQLFFPLAFLSRWLPFPLHIYVFLHKPKWYFKIQRSLARWKLQFKVEIGLFHVQEVQKSHATL